MLRFCVFIGIVASFGLLLNSGVTALAQTGTTTVADGLNSPRQLFYGEDGTLYIAEAGVGGAGQVELAEENIVSIGLTSRISALSPEGEWSVVIPGLPSGQTTANNQGWRGAQAIYITADNTAWIAIGEGPNPDLVTLPLFHQVLEIDIASGRILTTLDILGAEREHNPDEDEMNSDPTDLAIGPDGALYITDAACNCLWRWTSEDGLEVYMVWPIDDNPVPTGLAFGPDGDLYVSFLSGFPFLPQSTRIERYTGTELVATYDGLTLVTDLVVAEDGTVYAVEMSSGLGEFGFIEDSGRVVRVDEAGPTPVAESLPYPYGITLSPDGQLMVSINTAFSEAGDGAIIAIEP